MAPWHMGFYDQSGYSARVPRALAVRVEAWDEAGEPFTLEASGWAARIVQVRGPLDPCAFLGEGVLDGANA
jgi:hypothetical protein